MFKKSFTALKIAICGLLICSLVGCGTILYPERVGQRHGNIDPVVCILDGIGVLCFVIPGLIAFVVDFSNGTIYLPPGKKGSLDLKDATKVSFDKNHATIEAIEKAVSNETGYAVQLDRADVRIFAFDSMKDMAKNYTFVSVAKDSLLAADKL
ncbi:MAG: hypothetical protein LLG37_04765 [Spirochaetia bacterium]|nr:hypothetical protein [Spirochaetia bacterium]